MDLPSVFYNLFDLVGRAGVSLDYIDNACEVCEMTARI